MNTAPQSECTSPLLLNNASPGAVEIALEHTVAVLLENGPGFSVLFAKHLSSEPDSGDVFLEDCTQFRIFADDHREVETYPEVAFRRDSTRRCFFASPDGGATLFGLPGTDPYQMIELDAKESEFVHIGLSKAGQDGFFELLRSRFGKLPGFSSPNSNELHAPDTYANAAEAYPSSQVFL